MEGKVVSHPNTGWHQFNTIEVSLGDLNNDQVINIQDVILSINLVLDSQYSSMADLNFDGIVNILDVIQLINLILN